MPANHPEDNLVQLVRNPTRSVRIGSVTIGAGHPVAMQSMTATDTQNVAATVGQVNDLARPGPTSCGSRSIAARCRGAGRSAPANHGQSGGRSARELPAGRSVAPHVDKLRYNPGHLYHHEREKPWQDKVSYLVDIAGEARLCDSHRRELRERSIPPKSKALRPDDSLGPMLASALEHCELLDRLGFTRYCVSLKDSDPAKVIEVNRRFAAERPDVPLHLGVTEAGLPPEGIIKTRIAFEQLISRGIGDTIRVSLTVPNSRKPEEIAAGRQILADIAAGRVRSVVDSA